MNVTESLAAQAVLRWIGSLEVFEAGPGTPSDEDLLKAVTILAYRSVLTLGAGMSAPDAIEMVSGLLGLKGPEHG